MWSRHQIQTCSMRDTYFRCRSDDGLRSRDLGTIKPVEEVGSEEVLHSPSIKMVR